MEPEVVQGKKYGAGWFFGRRRSLLLFSEPKDSPDRDRS
jgi:hypothetical protein